MRTRWRDRLRYWFDGTMDRGTPALIGWLGLASVLLIVLVTGLFMAVGTKAEIEEHGGWGGAAWMNLMRAIDPGTMGGDTGRPLFLALMLTITIGGVFIVSSLIGVLTTGLENRIAQLRKGRSRLIEHGHTIVLGWSEQVFTVIEELVKANQGQRRSRVVILADRDKVDMDDEIRGRLGETGRTRVICRTGSPLKRADLELVSPDTAKAIMVLPPPGQDADIHVIKTLLLLNNRTWRGVRPHVVTAVQNSENVAAARLAGGDAALVIDADDIAVRLVVQSHRQAGLSTVCTDLLDFAGNEFYIRPEPALVGATYGEALHAYERGVPAGLRRGDGRVVVNPPMDTVIGERDHLIVLAEDDLLIRLADSPAPVDEAAIVTAPDRRPLPDRTLLIGWNARATKIIDLLDRLVEPGSVVDIAAARRPEEVLATAHTNLTVGYKHCEPTRRASLESLDLGGYKHIIVLADDGVGVEEADDRTLVTLLHLRDIEVRLGDPYSIVTEINNDDNREVFQVTKADDFIVSTKLISLLLTQLAENRHLQGVFAHLFDPSGSEIYLKPASDYVTPGMAASFATVIEAARRRGHTAIGYRSKRDGDQAPSYGVVLNPPRTEPLSLGADDNVIVLAEE
ncbi:lipoprotein [Sphaerisporangium siamense]|uniref:Voltage-gated potassium channel Kch n=1 Tax=Sphaerisporangium siamense TaxID=795645 RepID=A0A7W7D749_9ACTN|nr:potassium transporter TrkA [Sphaerisporangium siamense]MBB4701519.1 voltage-gated potassium channel Kch [Sphaerisporangium siamense]GII85644.1 lipoprotein [Sphaerisporangium siamense]